MGGNLFLGSPNNGTLFPRYQYVLPFSYKIIIKIVESESVFKKSSRKISKIFIFSSIFGHFRSF